ncbi:MAG TPA: DHA2 family efflux MFS transporter permease subunit [Acidimicrobiales bacterium]|nr:DHA2 family efflux MFS transporter permease subunit [Acidimicrobiales bacterium]
MTDVHAQAQADEKRWWILGVLCLSLVMVILGNTVLNVAIPTLVRELDASATELQWIVDAYALVFAGLLLTCGALGDRFGRKGALQAGLVIFGLASIVSTQATAPAHLIATRAVMGVGAALVMPATLSVLANVFPPQERARAIAIWAGLAGGGAAIGPIAGGWLLEHFYWGSVFFLNLPVVGIALLAGGVLVPTSKDPAQPPLDIVGALLSIAGLGSLLYAIIEAPNHGWAAGETLLGFALAAVLLGVFAWWELRTEHPMLDLRFFRDPRFTTSSMAVMLVFFAMFGTFFLMTQYLQLVQGYSALGAGFRTLPSALVMMVMSPNSARLVERFGARTIVSIGLCLVSLGLLGMTTLGVDTTYWQFFACLLVMSSGMSMVMPPCTALIMSSLPLGKAGVGSAVNDTTRELGGALGVAVLGSVLASIYSSNLGDTVAGLPDEVAAIATSSLGGALQLVDVPGLADAAKQAFVDGLGVATIVGAGVALAGALLVRRLLPPLHHVVDEAEALAQDVA